MSAERKSAIDIDKNHQEPVHAKDMDRLEHIAGKLDPPGHALKDEDLKDPGRMTPDAQPTDNRS